MTRIIGALLCWERMRLKLKELARLPKGWDSYGSIPPTAEAVESANNVLGQLFRSHHISPVSGGGIQFDFCIGNNDVEINVDADGAVEIWSDSCGR